MTTALFTASKAKELAQEYAANSLVTCAQIATREGCSEGTIANLLRRHAVPLRRHAYSARRIGGMLARNAAAKLLTPEQERQLLADYKANMLVPIIAKRYGIGRWIVWRTVIRLGEQGRPKPKTCTINEAAFDDMTNPLAQYFAGLLFADGCVRHREHGEAGLSLRLANRDAASVLSLRDFLKASSEPHIGMPRASKLCPNSQPAIGLTVYSNRLVTALARYGVVPRKSLTARVPDELVKSVDWWRGCVDGDGWVGVNAKGIPFIGFAGSKDAVDKFVFFAREVGGSKTTAGPTGKIWRTAVYGSKAIPVVRALYEGCNAAMPRKMAKAQAVLALSPNYRKPL